MEVTGQARWLLKAMKFPKGGPRKTEQTNFKKIERTSRKFETLRE